MRIDNIARCLTISRLTTSRVAEGKNTDFSSKEENKSTGTRKRVRRHSQAATGRRKRKRRNLEYIYPDRFVSRSLSLSLLCAARASLEAPPLLCTFFISAAAPARMLYKERILSGGVEGFALRRCSSIRGQMHIQKRIIRGQR